MVPSRSVDHDRAPVRADAGGIAGISHQTVSRVPSDHPSVPAARADGDRASRSGYGPGGRIVAHAAAGAVFCVHEHTALGLLRAAQGASRRMPRDVSIAGSDDTPEAGYFGPPPTTGRQDVDERGHRGPRTPRQLIGDGTQIPPGAAVVPALVVRASAGRPTG